MGDNELIKDYSPCGILLQTFAREAELEKITREHLEMMKAPTSVRFYCPAIGFPLRINVPEDEPSMLRIKRNKKHYKPKFTL